MALTLRESFADTTRVDVKALRTLGAGMLAIAAVRPLLPVEVVPPCPLRTLTGVPCPLCGMTTAVKAVCTGHVQASFTANPFGIVGVVLALVLLVRPSVRSVRVPVALLAGCAVASWLWELRRFGFL